MPSTGHIVSPPEEHYHLLRRVHMATAQFSPDWVHIWPVDSSEHVYSMATVHIAATATNSSELIWSDWQLTALNMFTSSVQLSRDHVNGPLHGVRNKSVTAIAKPTLFFSSRSHL